MITKDRLTLYKTAALMVGATIELVNSPNVSPVPNLFQLYPHVGIDEGIPLSEDELMNTLITALWNRQPDFQLLVWVDVDGWHVDISNRQTIGDGRLRTMLKALVNWHQENRS